MVRAMPSEGIQGDEWAAYVTLGRMTETYAGSPTGCEPYGDGEPIVAVGVTPHQGVRESRTQGEVAQVIQRPETRKVCEIAERRNGAGCLARARQAWSAAGEAVSATVQPPALPGGLQAVVCQQGCDDARGHRRDRGRHVAGQDRAHHRRRSCRAVAMASGETCPYPQTEREATRAGVADLVGQAAGRSGAHAA